MTTWRSIASTRDDFFAAVQFLTRIPVPEIAHDADSLAHSAKFFPIVGLLLGLLASLLHFVLVRHLPGIIAALFVVAFLVLITGALHEDAIADAADGFGGGWSSDQVLLIFRDSRIGSYGATALFLTLIARVCLIAALPASKACGFLIAAIVLSRWSILPLSFYLPSARSRDMEAPNIGQGARLAKLTSRASFIAGSLTSFVIVVTAVRWHAGAAIAASAFVAVFAGIYFRRRIGGVTGDCFGATIQLVEIAVLLTGVWGA